MSPPANRHRGEVSAMIDGRRHILVLTLGALAELEAAFGADDLVALTARFGSGRLTARDLVRIVGAGLRGGGIAVTDNEVEAMRIEGGAAGFARLAADLLSASFGGSGLAASDAAADGEAAAANPSQPASRPATAIDPSPSPGAR